MISSGTPDPDVITKFLDAPAGSGQERVLREHPELLDDFHQGALAALAARARERDPAWADLIDRSREFLAWRRSNPSSSMFPAGRVLVTIPPELADAFQTLGQTNPTVMFDEHPEVLGEQFGELLRRINTEARTVGDTATAEATEHYLRTIDLYRVAIASLMLGRAIEREVPGAILDGVDAMLGAANWQQAREAIEKHPSLLGEESDALWLMLLAYARDNGDRNAVGSYFEQRRFILTSRAFGVDLALAQWSEWVGAVPDELIALLSGTEGYALQAIAAEGRAELREASKACERLVRHPGLQAAPDGFRANALMVAAVTTLALDRLQPSPEGQAGAIGRLQAALECLPAPAAGRELCLLHLGQAFQQRFEVSGAVADLRAAAEALCAAAEIATGFSPLRGQIVAAASAALTRLTDLTGEVEPLDRRVSLRTEDLGLAGPFPVARAECVVYLALALFSRYLRTADDSSLDAGIAALDSEVDRVGKIAARAAVLQQLGHLLLRRYEARGEVGDLDQARRTLGEAVDAAQPRSALRSVALDHLGCAMRESYRRSRLGTDLDRAVALGEQAVSEAPDARLSGSFPATNLANSLLLRYDLAGNPLDLARAVEICENDTGENTTVYEADDPDRSASLVDLGNALRFLYRRTGDIHDLDRAIDCLERSLVDIPPKSPLRSGAETNLVTALLLRYQLTHRRGELDRIVELSEHVVSRDAPDGPRAAGHLGNLGIALLHRWHERGKRRDLNTAVDVLGRAVERAAKGSDEAPSHTANLAGALVTRSKRRDLDRAVALLEPVLEVSGPGTPERIRRLVNLGSAYASRHTLERSPEDLERATMAFREASTEGLLIAPEHALEAARAWSSSAAANSAWSDTAEGADAGLRAMRELFRAQLTRFHKELRLSQGLGLASLAAYAHCRVCRFADAATALEAGRGLLLREVLERDRADLGALVAIGREDLEQRYRAAAARCAALTGPTGRDGAWGPVADPRPAVGR
jgi:tetratricopeptide (TPR) repeat protein